MDVTVESAVDGTRLQLPAQLREKWGAQPLVASKGLNMCLYVHTVAEFTRAVTVISTAPHLRARMMSRFFASGAIELTPDVRGRLRISRHLMEYARIEDRVVWRVEGECLEVWTKAAYDSWIPPVDRPSTLRELLAAIEATGA